MSYLFFIYLLRLPTMKLQTARWWNITF